MFNNKKRVLFIGIPDMAYVCLDGLRMEKINIVGVLGSKKDHPTYAAFREFVLKRNLNFIEYDNLEDEEFLKKIKSLNADIAVVCSFNYKIPKALLETVKDGFINIHPSLLPKYRGANPYCPVIFNNEEYTGVTLHFMDEKFDTGDIITQAKLPVSPVETMGTLFNRLNILGLELLVKTLNEYEKNPLQRFPQPKGEFERGKSLSEDDFFIDYDMPAKQIERFIRGLNPFFIASTSFRETFVKIFSAEVYNNDFDYPVGTVAKIDDEKFYIATKEGLIAPTVLQFGSFFLGSSRDFIQILNPKVGEKFQ